jgi:hypothetical protein
MKYRQKPNNSLAVDFRKLISKTMNKISSLAGSLLSGIILISCGGENTGSKVKAPGGEKTTKSEVLETGAAMLQDKSPLKKVNMYLDGFHFYNGRMEGQMEAHHYVTQLNEDVHQAIIFDGNGENAKLMGVEYIISERLFRNLPGEEKKLWHSHHYEVKSGTLVAPGIPEVAEHELMEKLFSTYGKTIHTWHTDRDLELPLGGPMLMMGFTKDGQLKPALLADRDKRFNISANQKKQNRSDIPMPAVDPLANAWEKGEIRQFQITKKAPDLHNPGH